MNNGDFDNTINGTTMHGSDKKCPNCGGVMVFDPASGMLKCPYCDSVFDITPDEEDDENGLEQDLFSAEFTDSTDWGTATRTIICKFSDGMPVLRIKPGNGDRRGQPCAVRRMYIQDQ